MVSGTHLEQTGHLLSCMAYASVFYFGCLSRALWCYALAVVQSPEWRPLEGAATGTQRTKHPPASWRTFANHLGIPGTAVKSTAFMPCGTAVQVADPGLAPPAVSHILKVTAHLRSMTHMSSLANPWTGDGMVDGPSLLQMPGLYPGPEPVLPCLYLCHA